MKLFETVVINCVLESLRVMPVVVTSKTKDSKKSPKRSIKKKKFTWETKEENPESDSARVNSWCDDCKVASLEKMTKRSRVEST
ncbi:hypothetical protein A2U01_0068599, partial [Trifolium medium]|nr:hypothetical protein [Trifolium medium]